MLHNFNAVCSIQAIQGLDTLQLHHEVIGQKWAPDTQLQLDEKLTLETAIQCVSQSEAAKQQQPLHREEYDNFNVLETMQSASMKTKQFPQLHVLFLKQLIYGNGIKPRFGNSENANSKEHFRHLHHAWHKVRCNRRPLKIKD